MTKPFSVADLLGQTGEQELDKVAGVESPEEGITKLAADEQIAELIAAGQILGRSMGEEFVKTAGLGVGGGGDTETTSKWRQLAAKIAAFQGRDTSVGEAASRVASPGGILSGNAGTSVNPRQSSN